MAKLFPTISPSDIKNSGERKVAEMLCEFPSRVQIFHSFNWIKKDRRGVAQEGECDFTLIDPQQGILFLEVKGWDPDFDGKVWRFKGGEVKDPVAQVKRCQHEIMDLIHRALPYQVDKKDIPFSYGCAVVFCIISSAVVRLKIVDRASSSWLYPVITVKFRLQFKNTPVISVTAQATSSVSSCCTWLPLTTAVGGSVAACIPQRFAIHSLHPTFRSSAGVVRQSPNDMLGVRNGVDCWAFSLPVTGLLPLSFLPFTALSQ